jgi:Uma2 family endonuclease
MEVMTVTDIRSRKNGGWTIDDLFDLPDDGMRHELVDGTLLVSPAPASPHLKATYFLRRLLERQAPTDLAVIEVGGVFGGNVRNYFVPDLIVIPVLQIDAHPKYVLPSHIRLAVEVLSKHNRSRGLVLKRHRYASIDIPRYWIVNPSERTLLVLALAGDSYKEEITVGAGTTWQTDLPFPLTLDPADFCR